MRAPLNGLFYKGGSDAGHGQYIGGNFDSGAVGPKGTYESNIVLAIMLFYEERMKARLGNQFQSIRARKPGEVLRVANLSEDLRVRYTLFNREKCDFTISFHINSADTPKAAYIASYIVGTGGSAEELAKAIQPRMCAAVPFEKYGMEDGGVRVQNFAMVREPDAPSVLVEMGFISNPNEEQELLKPEIQKALGYAVADGVCAWLGIAAAPAPVANDTWEQEQCDLALKRGLFKDPHKGKTPATEGFTAAVCLRLLDRIEALEKKVK